MRIAIAFLCLCLARALPGAAQVGRADGSDPAGRPTPSEVRGAMGIPSLAEVRGQRDAVGFASEPGQMARVWERSSLPPAPEALAPMPGAGVAGLLCPHDDYVYAGRMYRRLVPLVRAKTVLIVGVFHQYRRFGAKDALIFDTYRAWRSPDGEIRVSSLREDLYARMPAPDLLRDNTMQDSEHSVEAIAYWLKHQDPTVEIVPVLVASASFERLQELASRLGGALADSMASRGWILGRDVSIVISSDGIHYGNDFNHTPHGLGGPAAYAQAVESDRKLLRGPLAGPVSVAKARAFFETVVDPADPDRYRRPWCGRFSIPFGLMLMGETARRMGWPAVTGHPVAFGTSIGFPQVRVGGLGATAEANLFHFVSYPGAAFTLGGK